MAEEYNEVMSVMNDLKAGIENTWSGNIENDSGLVYKPDGLNTYIPMKLNLLTEISNSDNSATNVNALKNKLEEAGFKYLGVLPFNGSAGPEIFGYLNPDNIVCGVYGGVVYQDVNDSGSEYAALECGKTNWHFLTNEEYELVNELGEALYDKTKTGSKYPYLISFDGASIKDSPVDSYQTLTVGLGGARGMFYRVSPTDKWQYFTAGQDAPTCDAYDTDDLKKAFAGTTCYDTNTKTWSTVQP